MKKRVFCRFDTYGWKKIVFANFRDSFGRSSPFAAILALAKNNRDLSTPTPLISQLFTFAKTELYV